LLRQCHQERQFARDPETGTSSLRLPKYDKTRRVPIPYDWLRDALAACINGRRPVKPGDNAKGLRYVVARYSNKAVAEVLGVSETAVRNWLAQHGIKRKGYIRTGCLSEDMMADIRDRLLFGDVELGPHDYLFVNATAQLPDPDHVSKTFERITKLVDLKPIRLHDLRHSFGTIHAEFMPIHILKEIMGHSSVTTTERYVHPTEDAIRRSMDTAERNGA
jgi:integrase